MMENSGVNFAKDILGWILDSSNNITATKMCCYNSNFYSSF